jgi:hypothetical protein
MTHPSNTTQSLHVEVKQIARLGVFVPDDGLGRIEKAEPGQAMTRQYRGHRGARHPQLCGDLLRR